MNSVWFHFQINLIFINSLLSVHCKDVAQGYSVLSEKVEGTCIDKSLSNNPYVLVIL